ncbi:MAG TPA: nucleoside deaminase [Desulfosalsimonadaceae bacterium]|nr:nucleoside deaminase [Desulfosalsimonadaceae bacterium]
MMRDEDFMELALEQARAALDAGEFPVGCVIADGSGVLAGGARRGSAAEVPSELDHAEILALRALEKSAGGVERSRLSLYVTMEPCLMCLGAIILNRIPRIVYAYEDVMGGAAGCRLPDLPELYAGSGVRIAGGVLRRKSLELFQAHFSDPRQHYWQNSLLARYTLSQE